MINLKVIGKIELPFIGKKKAAEPVKKELPLILEFFSDPNGRIISRMDNGKIAIIDRNYKGPRVNANEDWEVKIVLDDVNRVIINPVKMIISAKENEKLMMDVLQKLAEKTTWNETTNNKNNHNVCYTR